jgi:hypothetical protein
VAFPSLQAADRSKEVEVLKKKQAVEEGEMKVCLGFRVKG